jgi:hypothetical protein
MVVLISGRLSDLFMSRRIARATISRRRQRIDGTLLYEGLGITECCTARCCGTRSSSARQMRRDFTCQIGHQLNKRIEWLLHEVIYVVFLSRELHVCSLRVVLSTSELLHLPSLFVDKMGWLCSKASMSKRW